MGNIFYSGKTKFRIDDKVQCKQTGKIGYVEVIRENEYLPYKVLFKDEKFCRAMSEKQLKLIRRNYQHAQQ